MLALIFVILALVLFGLAAFLAPVAIGTGGRLHVNFVAAGLFFLTLATLVGGAAVLPH